MALSKTTIKVKTMDEAVRAAKAYRCVGCGKCTGVCPVAVHGDDYSPRLLVEQTLLRPSEEVLNDPRLWSCLGCGACRDRCLEDVDFPALMRDLRILALRGGAAPSLAHGGAAQALMRMMGRSTASQRRTSWIGGSLRVAAKSDVLFFAGCLPYFDPLFRYTGANSLNIARNTVRVLNHLGIEPMVLTDERCCGHDLLWSGDVEGFAALAEQNVAAIRGSGASTVVTACPECLVTLTEDYASYGGSLGTKVMHISEIVARAVGDGGVALGKMAKKVTFHDPCNLSRFAGIYDEPRRVLSAVEGLSLVEMAHSGTRGVCCGTQAWMSCGAVSKAIQVDRLREAAETGADLLVTACPKCQIHLKCAQVNHGMVAESALEIEDLTTLLVKALSSRST